MLEGATGRPRLVRSVKLCHPEGTGVFFAFSPETGERFELNEVSFEMLRRMDGTVTVEGICVAIVQEFEGAAEVQSDLAALLDNLISEGMVEYA